MKASFNWKCEVCNTRILASEEHNCNTGGVYDPIKVVEAGKKIALSMMKDIHPATTVIEIQEKENRKFTKIDPNNIMCPYCNEIGFDLIGLKDHFNSCEKFNDTQII